jgi:exopolysaccharide biosynthesis polyprenyl glycosylphosphotransferase
LSSDTWAVTGPEQRQPATMPVDNEAEILVASESPDVVIDLTSDVLALPATAERGVGGLANAGPLQLALKRVIDVVGSALMIVLLSPLFLVSALAIRVSSTGPALFRQERVGKDGRLFRMYKFRSMRLSAHDERDEVVHLNEARGPVFKIRDDPRLTTVGRVIRKLSIDELPQLFNVLRGDMSLVGPRPPLLEEVETYEPHELRRLSVRPGITCIWQVSGRSDLEFETWVEMDLEYIDTWTLRRDLELLLRTLPAVLSGRGAY